MWLSETHNPKAPSTLTCGAWVFEKSELARLLQQPVINQFMETSQKKKPLLHACFNDPEFSDLIAIIEKDSNSNITKMFYLHKAVVLPQSSVLKPQ